MCMPSYMHMRLFGRKEVYLPWRINRHNMT